MRFKEVSLVHYQAVSLSENESLHFFLTPKELCRRIKQLIIEVQRVGEAMWKKLIQIDRKRLNVVLIY